MDEETKSLLETVANITTLFNHPELKRVDGGYVSPTYGNWKVQIYRRGEHYRIDFIKLKG